jgi:alpha-glucosidase (family GH31 glycosyl hydrolase)
MFNRRWLEGLALITLLATACQDEKKTPAPEAFKPHTPRWAFEPWISKDISDTDDTRAFVQGFKDRKIPVGVVVLDSPWETNYTTFVPNPVRYHGFNELVSELRGQNIRMVLWTTQMVNNQSFDLEATGDKYDEASPNFGEAMSRGYFVNGGKIYQWWKGFGAGIDFFNPAAMEWWHPQQNGVIDAGIGGWKLDFGEDYITDSTLTTAKGTVTHQEYSEAYYHDFLQYGRQRAGKDFLTMVRPWDKSYAFTGRFYAKPEDAPVAWVGDNRRDWVGFVDALDHIFISARAGYVVIGSDIGGYLDRDDVNITTNIPFSSEVFLRWTAVGALTPFMQLHGRANLTPWTVPERAEETVTAYRYWSTLHHELVPFFYSLAEEQYAGGARLLDPVGEAASWPGDYRFVVGNSLLVAPLLDDSGKRDVELPAGSRWYDWWQPEGEVIEGGTKITQYDSTDSKHIPLFVREGAIIPMTVSSEETGFGTDASANALTVLVWPAQSTSTFTLHEEDDSTTTIEASRSTIAIARALKPTVFRVRANGSTGATANGTALTSVASRAALDSAASGVWSDGAYLWVKIAAGAKTEIALK